jgi:hypothetical protein
MVGFLEDLRIGLFNFHQVRCTGSKAGRRPSCTGARAGRRPRGGWQGPYILLPPHIHPRTTSFFLPDTRAVADAE